MKRALPLLFLGLAAFAQTGQQPKPLTNADVIEMSRAGVPESTIILAIQKTPVKFDVSAEGILALPVLDHTSLQMAHPSCRQATVPRCIPLPTFLSHAVLSPSPRVSEHPGRLSRSCPVSP
jgi:hypothetical protein